jgi:DNA-binding CsgD family transcriptional regulator
MARQVVKENHDQVMEWVKEGKSAYWISKQLGCGKSSVLNYLKARGVSTKHKCTVDYSNLLKDREEEVVQLYNSGKTCEEIGDITGHSGAQISILLKNSDLKIRDWKYSVNEHFFDSVDSEEVAYVLGWFYSDGCVNNKGKMRIQIQTDDIDILHTIARLMDYDGPLYDVPPPKKFPHRKHQTCLCINRKTLADQLIALGCIPNKSLTLTFPHSSIIPEAQLPHFIRGVFDGDGSISIKKNKYLNISITSSEDFIQPLRKYLLNHLNIDTKHYFRYSHTNTVQMMITATPCAKKFLNWLYQDANYYLTRKFEQWQEYCKNSV